MSNSSGIFNWTPSGEGGLGPLTVFIMQPGTSAPSLLAPLVKSVLEHNCPSRVLRVTQEGPNCLENFLDGLIAQPVSETKTLVVIEDWAVADTENGKREQQALLIRLNKVAASREDIRFVLTATSTNDNRFVDLIFLATNAYVVTPDTPVRWVISALRSLRLSSGEKFYLTINETSDET